MADKPTRHELLTAETDWFEGEPEPDIEPDLSDVIPTGTGHPRVRAEIDAFFGEPLDAESLAKNPHFRAVLDYLVRAVGDSEDLVSLLNQKTGYTRTSIKNLCIQILVEGPETVRNDARVLEHLKFLQPQPTRTPISINQEALAAALRTNNPEVRAAILTDHFDIEYGPDPADIMQAERELADVREDEEFQVDENFSPGQRELEALEAHSELVEFQNEIARVERETGLGPTPTIQAQLEALQARSDEIEDDREAHYDQIQNHQRAVESTSQIQFTAPLDSDETGYRTEDPDDYDFDPATQTIQRR